MNPETGVAEQSDDDQLKRWRGSFGDAYADRNAGFNYIAPLVSAFARILERTRHHPPHSILEVGANIGLNLRALSRLGDAELHAAEPNAKARTVLIQDHVVKPERVYDADAARLPLADRSIDLVFTSGVLIHIHPDRLAAACREIHRVAARWIVCIEYFAAEPTSSPYRGHDDLLFKRDFGQFWLDCCPKLVPVDCGFFWKRLSLLDNLTWWLFERADVL
jgi:pseudaminic acid biosynthesis-associated methylase